MNVEPALAKPTCSKDSVIFVLQISGGAYLVCSNRAQNTRRFYAAPDFAGVVSALGITTGGLVHTLAAALGLSALLMYSATAYEVVRWAGAAYLVYMGLKILLTRNGDNGVQRLKCF